MVDLARHLSLEPSDISSFMRCVRRPAVVSGSIPHARLPFNKVRYLQLYVIHGLLDFVKV